MNVFKLHSWPTPVLVLLSLMVGTVAFAQTAQTARLGSGTEAQAENPTLSTQRSGIQLMGVTPPSPGVSTAPMVDIYGHMGVGTLQPDISAAIDISSAHAGLLIPRLTQAQRDSIYLPATTLLIFNQTSFQFEYNDSTPVNPHWVPFLNGHSIIGFNMIGTGTNQGQTLNVGNGSVLQPTGTGIVIANQINGAGANKFAGAIPIPDGTTDLDIAYTGLQANAVVVVSISDPTFPGVVTTTTEKNPGIGFTVHFASPYPGTTGTLDYVVINP
ncbi:MAG: hypothetical protein UZ07_CHB004002168 [Chlorobi bacterium OLB7]|nr:MAG: hypothetical protein UZ07_CHB004002168 [Chlorobi bacterium OLB7]